MRDLSIVLADAAFLVREGIKAVTAAYAHLQVVGEARHSHELKTQLEQHQPDVVIIDYHAPGAFTVEDIRLIRSLSPDSGILVISSDLKRQDVFQVLEDGVQGFLLKECDHTEILGAIHAIAKNEKFFCGKVIDIILERRQQTVPANQSTNCEPTRLTERETEIVRLMAEGTGAQEIADQLSLSVHTIYTHRKNIMRKLGVTNAAEVILYAINASLVPDARKEQVPSSRN